MSKMRHVMEEKIAVGGIGRISHHQSTFSGTRMAGPSDVHHDKSLVEYCLLVEGMYV